MVTVEDICNQNLLRILIREYDHSRASLVQVPWFDIVVKSYPGALLVFNAAQRRSYCLPMVFCIQFYKMEEIFPQAWHILQCFS